MATETVKAMNAEEISALCVRHTLYDWAAQAALKPLAVAGGNSPNGASRRVFFPISASYSLSMQSSFYRKWLMHHGSLVEEG